MELKTAFINLDFTDLLLMVLIGLHYLIDSKIRRYETVKKNTTTYSEIRDLLFSLRLYATFVIAQITIAGIVILIYGV